MRRSCWGKTRIFSAPQPNELGINNISRHQATEMYQHFCRYFWCFHCLSCTQVQVTLCENLFEVPAGSSHITNSCPWNLQNHTWWLLYGGSTFWLYWGKKQQKKSFGITFQLFHHFSSIWQREVRVSLQVSQIIKEPWLGISGSLTKAECRLVKQREPEVLTSEKLAGGFGITLWYAASSWRVMINRFHISTLDHVAVVRINGSC